MWILDLLLAPVLLVGAMIAMPVIVLRSVLSRLRSILSRSCNTKQITHATESRKRVVSLCQDLDKVSRFLKDVFEVDLQEHFVVVVDSPADVSQFEPDLVVVADRETLETVREAVATPLVWINN